MAGVEHVVEKHLIFQQGEAEAAMLETFRNGDYTLKHPLVSPNLYRINPLSAVVAFRTETEQAVTVTVKAGKGIFPIHFQGQRNIFFPFSVFIRVGKIRWKSGNTEGSR